MKLTREQLLARVENAINMGLITESRLHLLGKWVDFVLRFEGGQIAHVVDFLEDERQRNGTSPNGSIGRLASDADGYALVQLTAILNHPCQQCAEDPQAWHTRSAFCPHKENVGRKLES